MTCRLEDSAYDYRISADAFAASPLEGGFERLDVAGGHDVRRLIEGATRSPVSQSALRSFLKAEAPLEQVHRLSDPAVRDRVAGLVQRRSAVIWRRPRRLGSSSWEGATEDVAEEASPEPTLAQAAPAAPAAPASPGAVRCSDAWAAVDAETRAVLARGGDADPATRNRHISAAYAQLYRRESSLTWGGLAAIVSRQAGCAMQDAKEMAESWRPGFAGPDDAEVAYRALADTNELIFEDVYPPMRFYERHGMSEDRSGAPARGPAARACRADYQTEPYERLSRGTPEGIRSGADQVARYEQIDIVQAQIYRRPGR